MAYLKERRVAVYLTPKNEKFLKEFSAKENLSKSSAVNDIIRYYSDKVKPTPEKK